jgi:hypothetical protein
MSMRLFAIDKPGAVNDGHLPLAVRVFAKTIFVIVTVTNRIFQEVVYTIREDIRHGQIQRIPEDWER